MAKKTVEAERPQQLVVYVDEGLSEQQRAAIAYAESGKALLAEVDENYEVQTQEEADGLSKIMSDVQRQWKFIDGERQVSVRPLNEEVKRINDWYRPALSSREMFVDKLKRVLGRFVLRQREEEKKRLAAAQAALEEHRDDEALVHMEAAANAAPKKLGKNSNAIKWAWVVKDIEKLPPEFVTKVVNKAALDEYVKEHGNKNVPDGVEVFEDVKFTVRT